MHLSAVLGSGPGKKLGHSSTSLGTVKFILIDFLLLFQYQPPTPQGSYSPQPDQKSLRSGQNPGKTSRILHRCHPPHKESQVRVTQWSAGKPVLPQGRTYNPDSQCLPIFMV